MIKESILYHADKSVFGKLYYPDFTGDEDILIQLFGSKVSCGFPSPATDYIEEAINLNKHLIKSPSTTYFIEATGLSMKDAFIRNEDLLIIDKSVKVRNGYPIVCWLEGEFMIKTYKKEKDRLYLLPANPNYKPIEVLEGMDFLSFGVVSYSIHNCLKL